MNEKIIEQQKIICQKYNSQFMPLSDKDLVAVALETIGKMPINGMRYITQKDENISWYIYCGEFSNKEDFFKPIHISHLVDIMPSILPYLSLEEGFGFVIDDQGYEDVWYGGFR